MRKEIIFAIILGLILGGIILYGLRLANQATKDLNLTQTTPTPTQTAETQTLQSSENFLTLTSPLDNSVSSTDKITVTGSGPANTDLALIAEGYQDFIRTDTNGNFSQEINLVGGENEISVSVINQDKLETQTITVIYTTAKIDL